MGAGACVTLIAVNDINLDGEPHPYYVMSTKRLLFYGNLLKILHYLFLLVV